MRGFCLTGLLTAVCAFLSLQSVVLAQDTHNSDSQNTGPYQAVPLGGIDVFIQAAKKAFGPRYAGVWFDSTNGEFRIGVVSTQTADFRIYLRDRQLAERLFRRFKIRGQLTGVQFSQDQLQSLSRWISKRLPGVNQNSYIPISVGEKTNLNYLEITTPPPRLSNSKQKGLINFLNSRYSRMIRIYTDYKRPVTLPCYGLFCDPPLRANILGYTNLAGCTQGFLARGISDGKLYQMTAGHCRGRINYNWMTEFTNATVHAIGPVARYVFGPTGDVAIVSVLNPPGWRARAWLVLRGANGAITNSAYRITADRDALVGRRVCVSGAAGYPLSCGVVQQRNVSVTYLNPRVTVNGLFQFSACVRGGDSGAPVFSGGAAYGIVSGGTKDAGGSGCVSFAEPIVTAQKLMGVRVAHDVG